MKAVPFGLALLAASAPAVAADGPATFDIPPGPLSKAIVAVGVRANVSIGLADPSAGSVPVAGLHGRMTVAAALRRLLAGTAQTVVEIDARTFQIVRRRSARGGTAAAIAPRPADAGAAAIVVTGSKRSAVLQDYAGAVQYAGLTAVRPADMMHGSETLVDQLPVLSSTHLGPGRNKLFIRGIADSSFNGPTQATVGQYLGDVRLNFNAPDPDLALYDVASAEVLEGPQGTLYGAGALSGVIRLVPVPPDLDHASLEIGAGGSFTAHSAPGGDASAIADLPLVRDRLGLRVVAYGSIDGGYIDDPSRGLKDINRTSTRGGRATLRFAPSSAWTIDLGGVIQNINSRDGQYSIRGLPPLQRDSVIAQPFDNDYSLGSLVVRHDAEATTLVSATSIVSHSTGSIYDASPSPALPTRYDENDDILLVTSETRMSHQSVTGGGWVVGIELLHNVDRLRRVIGPVGAEAPISGTRNTVDQASLFGEATFRLWPRWFVTGGARVEFASLTGEVLDATTTPDRDDDDDQRRHATATTPSLGTLWKASDHVSLYARYQKGYRPGGLSVQASGTQRFESDSVATWEGGLRYRSPHLTGSASLSYANWTDIQADLVDAAGLPYTANIGSGRIYGLEAEATWQPSSPLVIAAALFANHSRFDRPARGFAGEKDASLPNIADFTARAEVRYALALRDRTLRLSASAHYVGRSRLDVGPALDLRQGRYLDTALGASMPLGHFTVSLDATNLLDHRGNIFSLGDPFGVTAGLQRTPLRPRTIRLGGALAF